VIAGGEVEAPITFAFAAFKEWGALALKGLRMKPFEATHRRFLFYEDRANFGTASPERFLREDYRVQSMWKDQSGTLYEFDR